MSDRMKHLLQEASRAYEEDRDPFSHEWLVEHQVTGDECYDLSKAISVAIDMLLLMLDRGRRAEEKA